MATITGTANDDLLQGTAGDDTLLGLAGDDTLVAGAGNDSVDGGTGLDRVEIDRSAATAAITFYMLAASLVSSLAGTSVTGVEQLSFTAGSGNDGLVGGNGEDSLAGGAGNDALQGGAGADTLLGGAGADSLLGGLGADLLAGGSGADRFILQSSGALASTLAAPDHILDFNAAEGDRLVLRGEAIGTGLFALAGRSFGLSGQSALPLGFAGTLSPRIAPVAGLGLADATGGAGLNLYWQPGLAAGGWLLLDLDRDGLLGSADLVVQIDLPAGQSITAESFVAGTFSTLGTTAADVRTGSAAADSIIGFGGDDSLTGLEGDDTLLGGDGQDSLAGGAGFDSLLGGTGADTLDGGATTDVLDGGEGNDLLLGGAGDDLLLGGAGNDRLLGAEGNDSLAGGLGADTLEGGDGADTLLLQGMSEATWSSLAAMDVVTGFDRTAGDRLRLSNAWFGQADGSGANAGTYTGTDGIARALVFTGSTGAALAVPVTGMALPAQPLDGYQVYWIPGTGGGWLVLDLGRNGRLDADDLVVRLEGVNTLAAGDFIAGTFLTLAAGPVVAGTAGDDSLAGGSLGETFLGSPGNDRITGGAGAGNALSYAGLAGPVAVTVTGYAAGTAVKAGGGVDSFTGIQAIAGTTGADTLDAGAAGGGFFVFSLEGRAGDDLIIGDASRDGVPVVQVSYAASPGAISIDLQAGGGQDGWGGADTLQNIRRVAALSAHGDTVLGTAWDDVFLSGAEGNKSFDGRAGIDEWRYAGTGAITVLLTSSTIGGISRDPYVLKPGGTDRLSGIEVVSGGAGNDSITGSAADERLGGGAGSDTLNGGSGQDTVFYDLGGLAGAGVVVDLTAGTATDQWGGSDVLLSFESAWGSTLGDDLTGRAVAGTRTWLRGLAGNDTLRAPAAGTLVGADYAGDPAGITVDLAAGKGQDGWGGIDRLVQIGLVRGSDHADRIIGSTAAETLLGGAGNDTLDGGTGADRLEGGPGDDLYHVDNAADAVVEAEGQGQDTVIAAGIFTLPASVEVLLLAEAAGSASATGNGLDNLLVGNAAANLLSGMAGSDTLQGGGGADSLYGGDGSDVIDGGDGNDAFVSGSGADTLAGGDGDDRILAGADARFSGSLWFDDGNGSLREVVLTAAATFADSVDGGTGYDRWISNEVGALLDLRGMAWMMQGVEDFTGSAGADALLLAEEQAAAVVSGGDGNDTLSGTAAADRLSGGNGDDLLAGQAGDDTLTGSTGNDTLIGGAGNDVLQGAAGMNQMSGGRGDDTLQSTDWDSLLDGGEGDDLGTLDRSGEVAALILSARHVEAGSLTNGTAGILLLSLERLSVIGGAGDDRMQTGAGADTLRGGAGADRLDGGGGGNVLDGGAGDDTLVSSDWDATLEGGDGQDLVTLNRSGSLVALTMSSLSKISDGTSSTLMHGVERVDVTAGAGDDTLTAGAADDTLRGGEGNDRLDGGRGIDRLYGGRGNDVFIVDNAADVVFEYGGEGSDTVIASITYYLYANIEGLTLASGAGGIYGVGNALDNVITGNTGANKLLGHEGNDTILGGAGNDSIYGEAGSDSLLGEVGNDILIGGDGADTLDGGAGTDNLSGDAGNDSLDGGSGNYVDTLAGGDGDDTLNGASGLGETDRMTGGAGNDVYYVDSISDQVTEAAGGGLDTVTASNATGYYLPVNVEDLMLAGSTLIGVGNALDNRLTGNAVANKMLGRDGNDTILGGAGNDTLYGETGADGLLGEAGNDYMVGGDGADTLDGGAGADSLYGEGGDDSLSGGSGNSCDSLTGGDGDDTLNGASGLGETDIMAGGAGNDHYDVDAAADRITEAANAGIDAVFATIAGGSFYLPLNVENLVLLGGTLTGVGNALDNTLTGNADANKLLGREGNDTILGGAGNDTLYGEAGTDTFVFGRGTGRDVIGDFTPGTDRIQLLGLGFGCFDEIQAAASQSGSTVLIDLGSGDSIVLSSVTKGALTAGDFLFD